MKLKPSVILIILISLIVVYSVTDRIWGEKWRAKRATENTGGTSAPRGAGSVLVDYMIIEPVDFNELIVVTGTLVSNEQVDLRSEASGNVTQINFDEGKRVKKGDLLVKINDKDLQAQYDRAVHRQRLAEDRERRQKVLLTREAISQEEYDIALTELNSLRAETQLIKAQIERTEIRAPFNGVIGLRNVSVGEFISPQITVARLVDNNPIKLDFSIPERFFDIVKLNSRVQFRLEGDPQLYTATVYAVEPKIDISTRTIQLRALAPNPDGRLFPGAYANVQFATTPLKDAIMVPSEALLSEATGHKAFVYRNGIAELRTLEIGTRTERSVQVVRGLEFGDTLVVSGILQIRPNGGLRLNTQIN
ncbi:MAG: efflux RND transporter periplasmic adaptor subunit [Bacteroidales bacterium]|nr:efflux RND transporter periplasmic adaptor subunit [Bacteroidales bacterium]